MAARTTDEVGVIKIHPLYKDNIHYYFSIVDLPVISGEYPFANSVQYDPENKTLTYDFGDVEDSSVDLNVLTTYKLPEFLEQYMEKNEDQPIDIEKVIVQGSINGGELISKNSGDKSKIKTSGKWEKYQNALVEDDSSTSSFSVGEIRYSFLISDTDPTIYFLLVFVLLPNNYKKLLKLEPDSSNPAKLIASGFEREDDPLADPILLGAHIAKTEFEQYSSISYYDGTNYSDEMVISYPIML